MAANVTGKVVVIGSINMDLVVRSPKLPEPGETVIGGDLETIPGGKGANQAVAAAKLGTRVTLVGCVGGDIFASQLKSNLAAALVDLTYISEIREAASGVALIVVDDNGQNTIVVASGANARLSPGDVEAAGDAVHAADVVLLQLEVPTETVHSAARLAQKHGAKVILNPAPAQPLGPEATREAGRDQQIHRQDGDDDAGSCDHSDHGAGRISQYSQYQQVAKFSLLECQHGN